ncbi:MAG: asparagine synthase-related protein [Microthrixaceae bacterium]
MTRPGSTPGVGPTRTGATPSSRRFARRSAGDRSLTCRWACCSPAGSTRASSPGLLAEAGQTGLQTFSIGFDDQGGIEGNEFKYSDLVAREFGTDHHQIRIPTPDIVPALREAVGAMSEPMVSHDVVAFYLLSREVAKHLKVVQSGQGADEVLQDTRWYPPDGPRRPTRRRDVPGGLLRP